MYSLCQKCNNETGALYGSEYQRFHSIILNEGNIDEEKIYTHEFSIKPLKVFKQIICMFLSINSPSIFKEKREEFKEFILNKEECNLENVRLYMYIQNKESEIKRRNPFNCLENIIYHKKIFVSEFTTNGIGYILTLDDMNEWDVKDFMYKCKDIYDITFFKNYAFEEEIKIKIRASVLETNTPYTLDFRELSTIKEIKFLEKYIKNVLFKFKVSETIPIFTAYGIDSNYVPKIIFNKK